MKADFLNTIISLLLILLVIPGIVPCIASALNDSDNSSNSTTQASLTIVNFSTNPKVPEPNSVATTNVIISNTGDVASEQTTIIFSKNGVLSSQTTLKPIDPGSTATAYLIWNTPEEAGTVTITASIEGGESKSTSVSVQASTPLPDLTIASIIPDTTNPQAGQALNFAVNVKNQGTASSTAALATYYINGGSGQNINIDPLEAGASTNLAISLTSDQVTNGKITVRVVVDSGKTVTESNENNNALTKTVTVSGPLPDLTIDSISSSSDSPQVGDTITFTTTVRNAGSAASPASSLNFKIVENNETVDSSSVPIASLAAGETTQSSYSWTSTKEGSIKVTATVDPNASISESDETNNQNTISVTVGSSSGGSSSGSGSSSSSSSSSSSGIGSSYSKEPAQNVASKELSTRNVVSGNHIRFDFQQNNTCVQFIEYDALRTFMKTTTTVEELKGKSTFVSERPSGGIYKYFNVWVGDKGAGKSSSVSNGLVGFRIEKSWINNNSVNESNIALQLYNESWAQLYTKKVGEDNNYSYFTASVPSYSFFAITETGAISRNGNQTGSKLQDTLLGSLKNAENSLNGSDNNSRAEQAKAASKTLMAIILPLFLIFVGYLVVKKKI